MTQTNTHSTAGLAATLIKIGIIGAGGRMGRMLIEAVEQNSQTTLAAAIERTGSSLIGVDAGELVGLGKNGVLLIDNSADNLAAILADIDVLIDFSLPDATEQNIALCVQYKIAMVIGTTGLSATQEGALAKASKQIPIVYAGNFLLL